MKKCIHTILFVLTCFSTIAQNKFTYNTNGFSPKFIVEDVDNLKSHEIYNKTLKWIKTTYNSPDDVIVTSIENEMIRIVGIGNRVVKVGKVDFDVKYSLQIDFKDGKYKLTPLKIHCKATDHNFEWLEFDLENGTPYFNKDGSVNNKFESYVTKIPELLNDINYQLKTFIKSKEEKW